MRPTFAVARERPEAPARCVTLAQVCAQTPGQFLEWMARVLDAHAHALEALADGPILSDDSGSQKRVDTSRQLARKQRERAGALRKLQWAPDTRSPRELLAPIGKLIAWRANANRTHSEDVVPDLLQQAELLEVWTEDEHVSLRHAMAGLGEIAALKGEIENLGRIKYPRLVRRKITELVKPDAISDDPGPMADTDGELSTETPIADLSAGPRNDTADVMRLLGVSG